MLYFSWMLEPAAIDRADFSLSPGRSWLSRTRRTALPRPDSSVVERGPEKAGVGGSIPSLATTSHWIQIPGRALAELRLSGRSPFDPTAGCTGWPEKALHDLRSQRTPARDPLNQNHAARSFRHHISCENDLDVKLRRAVHSSSHYAFHGSGSLRVDRKTSHPVIVLRLRETSAQKLHELF